MRAGHLLTANPWQPLIAFAMSVAIQFTFLLLNHRLGRTVGVDAGLTAWLVGKTNRFKAAASQKPVINWTSMALTADGVPFFGPYWMGALPWENYQSYWARSPLSLMGIEIR